MNHIENKEKLTSFPDLVVLGSSGFVGSYVSQHLEKEGLTLATPPHSEIDMTEAISGNKVLDYKSGIVLNFVSFTDVDTAEKQRGDFNGTAWNTNVLALKRLSQLALENDLFIINIGSDFEFSGSSSNPGPYTEDETDPEGNLSWYGYSKAEGLKVLKDSGCKFAHIRISYPFGNINNPKDFLSRTTKYVKKGFPLFSDQQITPTFLPDLAKSIKIISEKQLAGVFHVATPNVTTPFEFARYFFGQSVKEGKLVDFLKENQSLAPRPLLGGLLVEKTTRELDVAFNTLEEIQFDLSLDGH